MVQDCKLHDMDGGAEDPAGTLGDGEVLHTSCADQDVDGDVYYDEHQGGGCEGDQEEGDDDYGVGGKHGQDGVDFLSY